MAGIQGETFAAEVVAQVVNRPLREVIHLLSAVLDRSHRLINRRTATSWQPDHLRYRFRHNLFQKYVYGHLDANELAYLHRLTAEGLAELYTSADVEPMAVAAELAYHFESAQVPDKAAHFYQLAGQYALQLSANSAASDHFRRSLALLSTLPETPENVAQQIDCGLAWARRCWPLEDMLLQRSRRFTIASMSYVVRFALRPKW